MRDSMRLVGMKIEFMPLSCCPALAHLTLAREHRAHVKSLEDACSVPMRLKGPHSVLNHTAESNIRRDSSTIIEEGNTIIV